MYLELAKKVIENNFTPRSLKMYLDFAKKVIEIKATYFLVDLILILRMILHPYP